ncbi:MAG TPA: SDR family NAD(P)-dependent oxidoreductase, partial [Usitatibacteraceae bacterium]|nr:SDR family NAD(P)-dependent oxidoreductase [Usitatibacteraceae bacterium]
MTGTAVITGAAEGIGRAIAEEAAERGMRLVLADIDAARLEATVAALRATGAEVEGLRTDVSKAAEVDALADFAFSRFGGVRLLVANAGVACAKPVWETTPGDWEWVMGVNLYGVT